MDFGTVLSVTQTLFAALKRSEVTEICSILGYKSQLDSLSKTVATISSVLLDAEAKHDELSHEGRVWIEELKEAVYDADDLLDEFVALAEQEQLIEGGNVSKKVRLFFSRFNPLGVAYKMSKAVSKIRKKLDGIASDHHKFGFGVNCQPSVNRKANRRVETCSYVYGNDIIGRDSDVEKVVGMLLDSDIQRDVSFLTVVGIGGLGKTTLAQLLYNDERITNAFPLRLWACVSDHDQKQMDLEAILHKILASSSGQKFDGSVTTLEGVQNQLREQLAGRKYLLVLDDVWNESRDEWLKFIGFLMGGQRGSWVVVTTRSKDTARIVGDGPMYELEGLSDDDSWRLFENMAFEQTNPPDEFVKMGQMIVNKCANVPLAIRAVGSLLHGQDKTKWQSFVSIGLAKIRHGKNGIMPVLKLSYDNLEPPLKSCFSYCAIFPKDFKINKQILINLWTALGYIVPLDDGQSIEDASEEYFSILLQRCFFQDVQKDEYGEIISCKMHDLMHEIAQEVSTKEICVVNGSTATVGEKVRHVSIMNPESGEISSSKTRIRTYLQVPHKVVELDVAKLLGNCTRLRVLDLSNSYRKALPDSIGKLLHLRFLDLSHNYNLELLPKTITKISNLQILILRWCKKLQELPKDLNKLVNLTVVDIHGCEKLTSLSPGIDRLTRLQTLCLFMVGKASDLEDLMALNNLKGHLQIKIVAHEVTEYVKGGAYLKTKEHLRHIHILFEHRENCLTDDSEELLLEDLQPHFNLIEFKLEGYEGLRMPRWATEDSLGTNLPCLSWLQLSSCQNLQCFPWVGKLSHLKVLRLKKLPNLEYVENNPSGGGPSVFSCLKEVVLDDLPKLRGWWPIVDNTLPSYPSLIELKKLQITHCPKMTFIQLYPKVEYLRLYDDDRSMVLSTLEGSKYHGDSFASSSFHPKQWVLSTNEIGWLKTVPLKDYTPLTGLIIKYDRVMKSLSEIGEWFRMCQPAILFLELDQCSELRSLTGGLEHLTALEVLHLSSCHYLVINPEEENREEDVIPWQKLSLSLRSLKLEYLPRLVNLPKGLQYLTNLQSLQIWCSTWSELRCLPEWMPKLTSLRQLIIRRCTDALLERCKNPSGEDWPNIQHIPLIDIKTTKW